MLLKVATILYTRNNREVWEDFNIAKSYLGKVGFQKPEEVIVEKIKRMLQKSLLLDIGVGLGRTTFKLAPLVKDYVAIDYSRNMLRVCKIVIYHKRQFYVPLLLSDARFLPFQTGIFDVVLFSYNGLDYASPKERIGILQEIRRVLKKGGVFIFSSHNLYSLNSLFKHRKGDSFLSRAERRIMLRALNKHVLRDDAWYTREFALLYDGSGNWGLRTYYVNPIKQIAQLLKAGFSKPLIFGLDGKEVPPTELVSRTDPWLYYLCEAV